MIRAAGDTVVALRREKAEAERQARTPVEAIEYKLPPDVQSSAEALAKIQREIAEETLRRDKLVSQVETTNRSLQDVQRSFKNHDEASKTLAQIKDHVNRIYQMFPSSLISTVTNNAPASKAALKEIAAGLRAFAHRIYPESAS